MSVTCFINISALIVIFTDSETEGNFDIQFIKRD